MFNPMSSTLKINIYFYFYFRSVFLNSLLRALVVSISEGRFLGVWFLYLRGAIVSGIARQVVLVRK